MKPTLLKEIGWVYRKKQTELGTSIPYGYDIHGHKNTKRQLEIREIFRKANSKSDFTYMDYDNAELAVDKLNKKIEDKPFEIYMPYNEGSDYWIIDFNNGLQISILTYDDYYGGGDSIFWILLDSIIVIDENISDEEVRMSVNWLLEIFK